jgi:protein kinase C substrate 80K-H
MCTPDRKLPMSKCTIEKQKPLHEMENPRVMKSAPLAAPSFLENRLLIFSFSRIIFRRFFFSFSSASTRAVSEEVAAFLIPLLDALFATAVEVLLLLLGSDDCLEASELASAALSVACFLRFFEPGAFLRECVRPCSASLCPRAMSRCLSASFVVRIDMTFSSV